MLDIRLIPASSGDLILLHEPKSPGLYDTGRTCKKGFVDQVRPQNFINDPRYVRSRRWGSDRVQGVLNLTEPDPDGR